MLLKKVLFYGIMRLVSMSVPFLLIPHLLVTYGYEGYSSFDYILSLANLLAIGIVLGTDSFIAYKIDEDSIEHIRSSVLSLNLFFALFLVTALLLLGLVYPGLYFSSFTLPIGLFALSVSLYNQKLNYYRWSQKDGLFLKYSLYYSILYFSIFYFIQVDIPILFYFFCAGIIVAIVLDSPIPALDRNVFSEAVKFGVSFGISSLIVALSPILERELIYSKFNTYELAYLTLLSKIVLLLILGSNVLQMAIGPVLIHALKASDKKSVAKLSITFILLLLFGFVLSILFEDKVILYLDSNGSLISRLKGGFKLALILGAIKSIWTFSVYASLISERKILLVLINILYPLSLIISFYYIESADWILSFSICLYSIMVIIYHIFIDVNLFNRYFWILVATATFIYGLQNIW